MGALAILVPGNVMPELKATNFFDEQQAANYDKNFAKLKPIQEALHLLSGAVLAELPAKAHLLCVGAGTGSELIYLAEKFPEWRFTAVEPSLPMLNVCQRRAEQCGIASRCHFHAGYLDTLSQANRFDAATAFLVSHFITNYEDRRAFFKAIAGRLHPGGYLLSADLSSDVASLPYQQLLEVWMRLLRQTGSPAEKIENLRVTYSRDVALLPVGVMSDLIASAGFQTPVLFLQTGLIHAWFTQKGEVTARL